jgi:nucleoside-diphosphate-sugar epimerase
LFLDTLFLGFGPISKELITKLQFTGEEVGIVSEFTKRESNFSAIPRSNVQFFSWEEIIRLEIHCVTTYVAWRESPLTRRGGLALLRWLHSDKFNAQDIRHFSSASVYPQKNAHLVETDFDSQIHEARNSKQFLEADLKSISLEKSISHCNYRIANVYGAGLAYGFINESIEHLVRSQPIEIFSGVELVRDFLLLDDAISALMKLHSIKLEGSALNISTGVPCSILELVSVFKLYVDNGFQILDVPTPIGINRSSVLDCKRLEALIPWTPQTTKEALPKLLKSAGLSK